MNNYKIMMKNDETDRGAILGYSAGTNEYNALVAFGIERPNMLRYCERSAAGGPKDTWEYSAKNVALATLYITKL